MLRSFFCFVFICLLSIPAYSDPYNAAMQRAITGDSRNQGLVALVSKYNADTVLFDLKAVPDGKSPQDVFRVLLQFTSEVYKAELPSKDLMLAAFGNEKFVVPANHVETTGSEYGSQNVMYTIRTFPQNVQTIEGERAFPERSGGLLYLMRVQMGDFNDFLSQWFIDDLIAQREKNSGFVEPENYQDEEAF